MVWLGPLAGRLVTTGLNDRRPEYDDAKTQEGRPGRRPSVRMGCSLGSADRTRAIRYAQAILGGNPVVPATIPSPIDSPIIPLDIGSPPFVS